MASPPPLVLIVEDDPLVREIAALAIEDAGLPYVEAADADEALEILKSRADVGVLFTDVNMPGALDGMDLAKLVHEQWPPIRLVVTSGRPLKSEVPDDGQFVAKPYDLGRLTQTLAKIATERP